MDDVAMDDNLVAKQAAQATPTWPDRRDARDGLAVLRDHELLAAAADDLEQLKAAALELGRADLLRRVALARYLHEIES